MQISRDTQRNSVSLFYAKDEDFEKISQKQWAALFENIKTSQIPQFSLQHTKEGLSLSFQDEGYELLENRLQASDYKTALQFLMQYIDLLNEPENTFCLSEFSYLMCRDDKIHLLPVFDERTQNNVAAAKDYIYKTAAVVKDFDPALTQKLVDSCHEAAPELAMLKQVAAESLISKEPEPQEELSEEAVPQKVCPQCAARYATSANFCAKCGTALVPEPSEEPEPKEPAQEQAQQEDCAQNTPQVPIIQEKQERYFEETTLLGFTNYGETSVLGGVMSGNYLTPCLIRKENGEKVFITKRAFVIGKSADRADFVISNSAVSRVHAQITATGNDYYITDQNSTNHTYVNGQQIAENTSVQIFDGDEIQLANEVFEFHLY